jgi:sugar phosphate isomerase/epimerase
MNRRQFLQSTTAAAVTATISQAANTLRFGHRQANMVSEPGAVVFELAKRIRGLSGVELQVFFKGTTLWDPPTLDQYRLAAERTGITIPSIAGVWPPGASLVQPSAEDTLRKAIHTAELLQAKSILVACFEQNCPNMNQVQSYGPVVELLQRLSGAAAAAGVVIGMETSNSPADDRKLIDLVDRPSIQVYYDLDNVERYLHAGEGVPGIALLKSRLRQVHLKNEDRLLEQPGRVNWAEAVRALAAISYPGWLIFETSHGGPQQCIDDTEKNIAFVTRHFSQPIV